MSQFYLGQSGDLLHPAKWGGIQPASSFGFSDWGKRYQQEQRLKLEQQPQLPPRRPMPALASGDQESGFGGLSNMVAMSKAGNPFYGLKGLYDAATTPSSAFQGPGVTAGGGSVNIGQFGEIAGMNDIATMGPAAFSESFGSSAAPAFTESFGAAGAAGSGAFPWLIPAAIAADVGISLSSPDPFRASAKSVWTGGVMDPIYRASRGDWGGATISMIPGMSLISNLFFGGELF